MLAILLIAVIFGSGLLGMMGLGGGIVYVPLLSWWGLDFATGAIPLSLFLGIATSSSAAYTYYRNGLVQTKTSLTAASTVLLGAPAGAWAMTVIPTGVVKVLFSAAAGYVVYSIFSTRDPVDRSAPLTVYRAWVILTIGFFVGFFSGLLGIGGGFLLVSFLLATGFPTRQAVATSSLVVVVSATAAFLSHLPHADFPIPTALLLAAAALTGSRLGGLWVTHYARPRTLRIIVGAIILVISLKMGWDGFFSLMK
ncbi:MAG: sulfite exporter TauE/SafE family protein [bacterium]|nr:sulfite exporter TauE/SafE family protein [bacterium]MDT8394863.1 sulfite exporter TauE/SafE family protein [bacterium]